MRPGLPVLPAGFCLLLSASLGVGAEAPSASQSPPNPLGTPWVQVAGNNQRVHPGARFVLIVRLAEPPIEGVHIGVGRVLTAGPTISCDNDLTDANGLAEIECVASAFPLETHVRITLIDIFGRPAPDFNIIVSPFTLREGLTQPTGDRVTVTRGRDFTLGVQAVRNGLPQVGLQLVIRRSPITAQVSCPEFVFTDEFGLAQIVCRSLLPLEENQTVLITVADGLGRTATFTVFLLARDELINGVFKVSGDQATPENSGLPFPLVALTIRNGQPAESVRVTVQVTDPTIVFCPSSALSGPGGLVYIFCGARDIQQNGSVRVFLRDEELDISIDESFGIAVTAENFQTTATLALVSDPVIEATAGDTIERAVRVQATDSTGMVARGLPVFFTSDQNITFRPPIAITGPDGVGQTSITVDCPGGDGQIRAGPRFNSTLIRVRVDVDTGGPTHLFQVQGNFQTGAPNQLLDRTALRVRLTDRCFNPIQGEFITWSVEPEGFATFENVVNRTSIKGGSSVLARLGSTPGEFTVTARHRSGLEQTFNLEIVARPAGLHAMEPDRLSVPRGELSEPLEVHLTSEQGAGIPGSLIEFTLDEGSGELTETLATTNLRGVASTRFRAGDEFGPVVVSARLAQQAAVKAQGLIAQFQLSVGGRFPEVPATGFVDGAAFRMGWVPGGLATIFGTGLVETPGVTTGGAPPFPTELEGVSVRINGVPAPLLTVANTAGGEQINLQTPFEISAPSNATVTISNNGSESVFEDVQIRRVRPGIFEIDVQGGRFAAALHSDFRLVAPADPARPGETILLFLTGMGPTNPTVGTNEAGPTPAAAALAPLVALDGQPADDFGAFYAPGLLTVYQINFAVPVDAASGDLELRVTADGATSNAVLLPVRR